MTNKKTQSKTSSKPQEVKKDTTAQEPLQVRSGEKKEDIEQKQDVLVPEEDVAVQNAKAVSTADQVPPVDQSAESKEAVKEHEKLIKDIDEGEATLAGNNPQFTESQIKKPLVPNELNDKPVYETAQEFFMAQATKKDK